MKTKSFIAGILILSSTLSQAATNDLTSALQRGLFEEEANRNLEAAAQAYQTVSAQFDKDRKLAATAIFRLGEIYRKQGKTNEAAGQYERIVREFADQDTLVTLSRQNLAGIGAKREVAASPALTRAARREQKRLFEEEIKLVETELTDLKKLYETKLVSQADVRAKEREVLKLRQQAAALDVDMEEVPVTNTAVTPATDDDEEKEIRRIQVMIKDSPDLINAKDAAGGTTPLHTAAYRGQLTVAQFLLANGADVEARDRAWGGRTPLQYAAEAGRKAMVDLLLSKKANVNSADNTGNTALHLAVVNGFRSVVEVLVAGGANVNAQRITGVTPLHLAVVNGYQNMAETLLKSKADPNVNTSEWLAAVGSNESFSATPLHIAVGRGDRRLVELLLTNKADINASGNSGTPLHVAVQKNVTDVVGLLLAKGAEVNATNQQGTAPLLIAIERQNPQIARLLLDHKANPDTPGMFTRREPNGTMTFAGSYPLRAAVQLKNLELLTLLLERGADPNTDGKYRSDSLGPPLWLAVSTGNEDAVKKLLQFKANPDSVNFDDQTPLMRAALEGNRGIVELLLSAGADAKTANKRGWTALHLAAGKQRSEIVQLLLASGADPNVRNSDGQTPLDLAKQTPVPVAGGIAPITMYVPPVSGPVAASTRALREPIGTAPRTQPTDVAALLRQHGALEELPDFSRIEIRRSAVGYSAVAFQTETNGWNQFSLLELIALHYGFISPERNAAWEVNRSVVPSRHWQTAGSQYPDFGRVAILRPASGGAKRTELNVNVAAVLDSDDCARDVELKPGDVVEIPEMDHPVNREWSGLDGTQLSNLLRCVSRTVTISIKGTPTTLRLTPEWKAANSYGPNGERMSLLTKGSFMLKSVLAQSQLVRASSDLSRVKVLRRDANGKPREWVIDCSASKVPDLWLRDGDVIEVPDKQ